MTPRIKTSPPLSKRTRSLSAQRNQSRCPSSKSHRQRRCKNTRQSRVAKNRGLPILRTRKITTIQNTAFLRYRTQEGLLGRCTTAAKGRRKCCYDSPQTVRSYHGSLCQRKASLLKERYLLFVSQKCAVCLWVHFHPHWCDTNPESLSP